MSYTNINSVNIYNSSTLTGDYNIDNNSLHRICNNIPYINCRLYYKKYYVSIKKNPEELKMKILTTGLSKELVYFLDNIPDKVDILVLNDFILNERFTEITPRKDYSFSIKIEIISESVDTTTKEILSEILEIKKLKLINKN